MRIAIALAFALLAASPALLAQGSERFRRDCAEWIAKKGYSSDYIEERLGAKPAGDTARDWRPNLDAKDAQPNDIVFIAVESSDGRGRRAEVVDEVERAADGSISGFRTSSMNIGKVVDARCAITENFGQVSRRRVAFDRVVGAWRPAPK